MKDRSILSSFFLEYMKDRDINNPVHSAEIEKHFQISGSEVRAIINELRNEGVPIGNTIRKGDKTYKIYFYAKSKSELLPTLEDLISRRDKLSIEIARMRNIFFNNEQLSFSMKE